MQKVRVGYYLPTDVKAMIEEMAATEERKLSTVLERLIRQEYARRQQPRVLIDTAGEYDTEEVMNDA